MKCECCGKSPAHSTNGWYRVNSINLCTRCDKESVSKTSEYEVKMDWDADDMGFSVVRVLRSAKETGD